MDEDRYTNTEQQAAEYERRRAIEAGEGDFDPKDALDEPYTCYPPQYREEVAHRAAWEAEREAAARLAAEVSEDEHDKMIDVAGSYVPPMAVGSASGWSWYEIPGEGHCHWYAYHGPSQTRGRAPTPTAAAVAAEMALRDLKSRAA